MIQVVAILRNKRNNGEGEVFIEVDIDGSQSLEYAKFSLLDAMQQLRLLANWGYGQQEMGMVQFVKMLSRSSPHKSAVIYYRSDIKSIDREKWDKLNEDCAGVDADHQHTFQLTCLTLAESQVFDTEVKEYFEKSVLVVDQQNEG